MSSVYGYDIGGGELPLSSDLIVIDKITLKEKDKWWKGIENRPHYIRRDVSKAGWADNLTPKQYVYCSRLLRYLPGVVGKIYSDPLVLWNFADEISKLVASPGCLVLFDYSSLVMEVVSQFTRYGGVCNWWYVGQPELINPSDGPDHPSESQVVLIRNPTPIG